ncbi:hypothetical protein DYU11_22710 [Fibrisoma montanum]|uniref:Uncharacterized protein n=1 Tax=Fibrisoma montanum TaxID=2305895 RepID=A0A418M255_9BACT|nr:hypothetical protein [Fibrisoma montanum]RIV19744.1 hypothetical protein DYU11_22710 [Fibrisoma montanum]
MSYIDYMNRFWQADRMHSFTGNESRVYYALLNEFSSQGKRDQWPDELRLMDARFSAQIGQSVNTFKRCRNRLFDLGLIDVTTVGSGSRTGAVYRLKVSKRMSKNDTLSDTFPTEECQKECQKEYQNLTVSHIYNEFQTKETLDSLTSFENALPDDGEVLEVEAEEVTGSSLDDKQSPSTPDSAAPPSSRSPMVRPTLEQIKRHFNLMMGPDWLAEDFFDHYESNGWKVGRNPMKKWQAAANKWIRDYKQSPNKQANGQGRTSRTNGANRHNQSRAESGAEIDRLVEEYFGAGYS